MDMQSGMRSQSVESYEAADKRVKTVVKRDGRPESFYEQKIFRILQICSWDISEIVDVTIVFKELYRTIFDGVLTTDIEKGLVLAAAAFIEYDPAYSLLASRLLRQKLMREVTGRSWSHEMEYDRLYRDAFVVGIQRGVALG